MKFLRIEVGDLVLVRKKVPLEHRFLDYRYYTVASKVATVTPKQFVTEDGFKWRKKDGKCIGETYLYCDLYDPHEDETEEMEKTLKKSRQIARFCNLARDIEREKNRIELDTPDPDLGRLEELLVEAQGILDRNDQITRGQK
jgi:hypothetical protein